MKATGQGTTKGPLGIEGIYREGVSAPGLETSQIHDPGTQALGSGQRPDLEGEREFREGEEQNLPLTNNIPRLSCPTGQTYGIRRGLG